MRIIAGEFRSRKIKSVPGLNVRPTPDRLRESLFSVLTPVIEGVHFIDAYAGCGSVGIEAISRGAARVTFLERSNDAILILRENLRGLRAHDRATLTRGKAAQAIEGMEADIIFCDPPYDVPAEYDSFLAVARAKLVIAQHSFRQELADSYGPLHRVRLLRQGENCLSFYRPALTEEPGD